jgi:hypothetical protein
MSEVTRKYQRLHLLFFSLSMLILTAPVVVYVVIAFVQGEVHEKLTLGTTVVIAVILTVINMLCKFHIRSTLWIVVLGIYFCLDNILPLLLMVAIGTILDEFVLTPLCKKYKAKANINKEIDKRG